MEDRSYRSSINNIPEDQSKIKNTAVPLFFSLDFEKDKSIPVVSEPLVRCEKCKAYLNPYVEIIMPGFKWKCNLCDTISTVDAAFQMTERRTNDFPHDPVKNAEFNRSFFVREDLRCPIYEIEAPDSFVVKTPESPVICFIIDVSLESQRLCILGSVLNSIKEVARSIEYDPRTKFCFMFYDESCYFLNKNYTVTVISNDVPLILADRMLFPIEKISSIDFSSIEKYFENKKSQQSNILLPIRVAIQGFRSASIMLFVSTIPNCSTSALKPSQSIICNNSEYKIVAESLFRKNLCVNLFIMARSNVELSAIRVLSQHTGGQTLLYSNYDGTDPVYSAKLYVDLSDYFERNMGFGAVCRIRANEGVILKNIFGNFCQKGADLIGFANYNPAHSINFTLSMFNDVKGALFVQVAMIRVTKLGRKLIRVFNICIPISGQNFYSECDSNAIVQAYVLESLCMDWQKSGEYLQKKISSLWREIRDRHGSLPVSFHTLPQLILAARKSIPMRPDSNTPTDFRSFHSYLMSNSHFKIFDLLVYPILLNLLSSNVVPLPLTMQSITQESLFLLDAGVSIFFYVGKSCGRELVEHLFNSSKSGPILFAPGESEYSKYISDLVSFLVQDRAFKPRFVLVDDAENSVYSTIFFSYMHDDKTFGLPSIEQYSKELNSIFN